MRPTEWPTWVSWTQFAKTGSPSSDLLDWPRYNQDKTIAYIDSKIKLKTYNNLQRIKLLNESKIIY